MDRKPSLCFFFALMGLVAACGGRTGLDGANGESGGAATTMGGGGGEPTDGGAMCIPPPPPSPTMPDQPGCYENDMGSGWFSVPCLCDLWLTNTMPAPITAGIQLLVTPPEQVPTLNGPLDVEVAFDDPDASWYATWTKQAGNGAAFTVTNEGGTTTVRMGEGSVVLASVPLTACETRKAIAHVSPGSNAAKLSMHAVLGNGSAFATTDGTCMNPPPL